MGPMGRMCVAPVDCNQDRVLDQTWDEIRCPKNFSLYFWLDRPQYLVVLTDHSLDAMSEMR